MRSQATKNCVVARQKAARQARIEFWLTMPFAVVGVLTFAYSLSCILLPSCPVIL